MRKAIEKGYKTLVYMGDALHPCCRILKVNEKEKIDSISAKAMKDGREKVQANMSAIRRILDALGKEAESHRREKHGLSHTTRYVDNLDAPTRSLQYLEDSVKGAKDAIIRGFAMGIRISKVDLKKKLGSLLDHPGKDKGGCQVGRGKGGRKKGRTSVAACLRRRNRR